MSHGRPSSRSGRPSDPETRGRPSPQLPPVQPSPPPPSSLTVPLPPQPSEGAPLAQGPRFVLRDVTIAGNTVLDQEAIRGVVDPYLGKSVTTADLEEIRRQLTLLYINRGYINSGVVIPDQNVVNGVVAFRVVEGRVSGIEVTGTDTSIRNISLRASPAAPNLRLMSRIWRASSKSCCKTRWSSGSTSSCCPASNLAKRAFMPTFSRAAGIR